ncbi:unnamed protein product [Amoebophrya sp. A25]|nr:unnamed protein product [Amoebophrya sp. A25]|eukprot:GSA25T00010350001.1
MESKFFATSAKLRNPRERLRYLLGRGTEVKAKASKTSTTIATRKADGKDKQTSTRATSAVHKKVEKVTAATTTSSCAASSSVPSTSNQTVLDLFKQCALEKRPVYVCAPMVGASELAFRELVRQHDCDLCYTPMMYADKFVTTSSGESSKTGINSKAPVTSSGKSYFPTTYAQEQFFEQLETLQKKNSNRKNGRDHRLEGRLVAHFCGNNPETLLAAAKLVENHVDAVDLNLGCPQRIAHAGHFGAYLLGQEDRPLLKKIVATLAKNLCIPVCCKIRLLDSYEETLQLCKDLKQAGSAWIAVHARARGTATRRREGAANLEHVKKLVEDMGGRSSKSYPILANGNVITGEDVITNWRFTGAAGIMSAEGLLDNPRIFADAKRTVLGIKKKSPPREKETTGTSPRPTLSYTESLHLARQYLRLAEKHFPPESEKSSHGIGTVVFHVRRMCKSLLQKFEQLEAVLAAKEIKEIDKILDRCKGFLSGEQGVLDHAKGILAKKSNKRPASSDGKSEKTTTNRSGNSDVDNGPDSEVDDETEEAATSSTTTKKPRVVFDPVAAAKEKEALKLAKKSAADVKKFQKRMERKANREGRTLQSVMAEHKEKSAFFHAGAVPVGDSERKSSSTEQENKSTQGTKGKASKGKGGKGTGKDSKDKCTKGSKGTSKGSKGGSKGKGKGKQDKGAAKGVGKK